MAIKVEIEENEGISNKSAFPLLAQHKKYGHIVYFRISREGLILLQGNSMYPAGALMPNLDMTDFIKLTKTKITLSNE